MTARLRELDEPVRASEKVVLRIMREEGLVPRWMRRKRRPYSSYAGEPTPAPPNLVRRDFRSALPNFLWLTDITEFRLPSGRKVYLSAIRDCFDSSVVAWRAGERPDAALANSTLEDACARLAPGERPVIHSDRGGHYRWPGWISICEDNDLTRSMSAKGCSPDNAAMEGFFGLLKREFWHGRDWSGWAPARFIEELGAWIGRYNTERRSDALGGRMLASIYFSPFSPTYFRQSRQRGSAGSANADAPLSASRPPPPSRPHRRWMRPSGGTTVPLS